VSAPPTERGTTPRARLRATQAALVGIAAGLVGVAVSRAVFGPGAAPYGIVIGGLALGLGTVTSWRLHGRRRPADSPRVPNSVRLARRVHPVAWVGPLAASVITLAAWTAVAHSSGSGWVQAVGALLGAFLLVGLVVPAWPARRAQVVCTACPLDGQAGHPLTLVFEADRPIRLRPIFPGGTSRQAGGVLHGVRSAEVAFTPRRRGVLDAVVVEVASSAPFGLVWWAREVELPLPHLVHVAPRTGPPRPSPASSDSAPGDAAPRVPAGAGEPRGIRPYASGDPRRAVHWPATSHAGTLMVRESERPTDDPVYVDVVLPADPAEAETEAERVMAGVGTCLARHQPVVLATREEEGTVVRPAADRLDLGRRLARAVST
jgi:uncharacterized protein (DUF58 family)